MKPYSTAGYPTRVVLAAFFVGSLLMLGLLMFSACRSAPDTNRHPRAPEPGTYRSTMMKAWLTVTPYSAGDPRMGTTSNNVDYGVGSTSFKGLFGDLVLHDNGTYAFTADKRDGTWTYIPEKDSVAFTGLLEGFRIKYEFGQEYLIIYTGGVKMPDGGELNIRYLKKREKPAAK